MKSIRPGRLVVTVAATVAAVLPMPAATAEPLTVATSPAFGVNMSFFNAEDTLVNSAATQELLRDKGVPLIRVPLRGTFDGNPAPIGDDLLLRVMRAARGTGATRC